MSGLLCVGLDIYAICEGERTGLSFPRSYSQSYLEPKPVYTGNRIVYITPDGNVSAVDLYGNTFWTSSKAEGDDNHVHALSNGDVLVITRARELDVFWIAVYCQYTGNQSVSISTEGIFQEAKVLPGFFRCTVYTHKDGQTVNVFSNEGNQISGFPWARSRILDTNTPCFAVLDEGRGINKVYGLNMTLMCELPCTNSKYVFSPCGNLVATKVRQFVIIYRTNDGSVFDQFNIAMSGHIQMFFSYATTSLILLNDVNGYYKHELVSAKTLAQMRSLFCDVGKDENEMVQKLTELMF